MNNSKCNIEIVGSGRNEGKRKVESQTYGAEYLQPPSWQKVDHCDHKVRPNEQVIDRTAKNGNRKPKRDGESN